MINEIKNVLTDFLPADKVEEIAEAIINKLDPECVSEEDAVKYLFSPAGFMLFKKVEEVLVAEGDDLSDVERTYDKIKKACKGTCNGIMLLALAEALSGLLVAMMEQVKVFSEKAN